MGLCNNCLCHVCYKINCPRGTYHCLPCHNGPVLECDYFIHKKVSQIYKVKSENGENLILDRGTLAQSLAYESARHKRNVKAILEFYKNRK